jgi:peptide/nickel transport system permease protein
MSVWELYITRFPKTLQLALVALVLGVAVAIPLGIFAAKHAGTIWDNLTTVFSLFGISMPPFWLGLLLLFAFSYHIKLFPAVYDGTIMGFVLPAVTTGFVMAGTATRQTRSAMLEVARQDYLRTARAKGVPERQVTTKHALRNAWIPIITTIGMTVSRTLAGSAVVEAVFSWPGVGRMTVEAVSQRDVPLACGCVILTTILYVVMLLIVDLLYAVVDPRIRAQYSGGRKKKRRAVA